MNQVVKVTKEAAGQGFLIKRSESGFMLSVARCFQEDVADILVAALKSAAERGGDTGLIPPLSYPQDKPGIRMPVLPPVERLPEASFKPLRKREPLSKRPIVLKRSVKHSKGKKK